MRAWKLHPYWYILHVNGVPIIIIGIPTYIHIHPIHPACILHIKDTESMHWIIGGALHPPCFKNTNGSRPMLWISYSTNKCSWNRHNSSEYCCMIMTYNYYVPVFAYIHASNYITKDASARAQREWGSEPYNFNPIWKSAARGALGAARALS